MRSTDLLTAGAHAIVFDLYDTLAWLDAPTIVAGRARLAAVLGVDADALGRAYRDSFPERVIGGLGDGRAEMLDVVSRLGIEADDGLVDRAFHAGVAGWCAGAHLYDDVVPALELLRARGVRLAILSNCSHEARALVDSAGLASRMDAVVLSCEVGVAKPDPAIFRLALRRVGASAATTLYVDDLTQHLDAAAALGMRTCRMARAAPAETDDDAGSPHPVVTGVDQLI